MEVQELQNRGCGTVSRSVCQECVSHPSNTHLMSRVLVSTCFLFRLVITCACYQGHMLASATWS
jgi:hypothetical protein